MKQLYFTKANVSKKRSAMLLIFFFILPVFSRTQQLLDSINWSVTGLPQVTISHNNLYIGGIADIGQRVGSNAFFLNNSSLPAKRIPTFSMGYSISNMRMVYAALSDGHGGWYFGGDFDRVNGQYTGPVVHILPNKSIDPTWSGIAGAFPPGYGNNVCCLKIDGNYLYVGGDLQIKDKAGNVHKAILRIDLIKKEIDPKWNPGIKDYSTYIKKIVIGKDKVFFTSNSQLNVVDKITGKAVDFPTGNILDMTLLHDTLIFGASDFGYTAKYNALLDTTTENPIASWPNALFASSIPDGKGGWYVASQLYYDNHGIFHIDSLLRIDSTFNQKTIYPWDDYGRPLMPYQMALSKDALFVGYFFPLDVNGKKITQLFKLNAQTGEIDTSFSPNPNGRIYSMVLQGDTLIVGGLFDSIAGQYQPHLAALNINTGELIDWHPKVDNYIHVLKIYHDTLYAGGKFIATPVNNHSKHTFGKLVRYNLRTGNLDTNFYVLEKYINKDPYAWQYAEVTGLVKTKNKLFFSGFFDIKEQNQVLHMIAKIKLDDLKISPINKKYSFSHYNSNLIPRMTARNGIVYVWGLAVTDTASRLSRPYFFSFSASNGLLTSWNPNPSSDVFSFSFSGSRCLLSGWFSYLKTLWINDRKACQLAAININTQQYIPIYPPGKQGLSNSIKHLTYNNKYLFALTDYDTQYGDSTTNGIIRLNRKDLSFKSFHVTFKDAFTRKTIPRLLSSGRNGLYVGGDFSTVNGLPRPGICLLDPETGVLKEWNPPRTEGTIQHIICFGNNVLLSGNFHLMPSYKRSGLAKIDLSTGKMTAWMPDVKYAQGEFWGFPSTNKIKAYGDTTAVLFDDPAVVNQDTGILFMINGITGQLIPDFTPPNGDNCKNFVRNGSWIFVTGRFNSFNGKPHKNIAKVNFKTGKVDDWNPNISGTINAIAVWKDTLYMGGDDLQVNDTGTRGILISLSTKTGKVYKIFPQMQQDYDVNRMAVNDQGIVVVNCVHNYYGKKGNKSYLLYPGKRDTLIEVPKLEKTGKTITALRTAGPLFLGTVKRYYKNGHATSQLGFFTYDPDKDTIYNDFGIPVANPDEGISSFAFNDKFLVTAGLFEGMYGNPYNFRLAFLKMPNLHLKPGITSWAPHKADNRNPFALRIYGTGFSSQSKVSLISGDKSLSPDSLIVSDNRLIAWFNGSDFSVGDWDMKVDISPTLSQSFPKAIHISKATYPDLWISWTGPKVVLVHKPETFYVTFGNKGNADAFGVFLYIAVGENQTVSLPKTVKKPEVQFKHIQIDMDTVPSYVHVDYFNGKPFKGKVYTLFIPYVPAHFQYALKTLIRSDLHGETPKMMVAISPPLYDSFDQMTENMKSTNGWFSSFFHCAYDVASTVANLTPGVGCVKSYIDNFGYESYVRYKTGKGFGLLAVTKSMGLFVLDCAENLSGFSGIKTGYKIARTLAQAGTGILSISSSCDHFFGHLFGNNTEVETRVSVDPNDKFGPIGKNASRFVKSDMPYQYLITFENDSAATAPAQRVIIIDTLDKNVFDLNTFRALGFGFGDTTYQFKETDGDTVYIDLRPAKNAVVRVYYHLDQTSGLLTWEFQTLNPDTYEWISNVNDGFLPPNRKPPEGDGNILYSIRPLTGLSDGTEIKNKAHIIFDWNTEIPTKAWQNTTDNTPPESAINTLPAYEPDTDFTVSWHGSDDASGIYGYTVYVAENDSAYYVWLPETHDTSAVFSGEPGVTYKFYSIAIDSAGNVEQAPSVYDASTYVSGTGIETFGKGNQMQFRIYPNPAKEHLTVDYYLPESSSVRIDVLNACGHLVQLPVKTTALRGTSHVSLDISHLPSGYYFVRILTKYGVQIRKIIKQ